MSDYITREEMMNELARYKVHGDEQFITVEHTPFGQHISALVSSGGAGGGDDAEDLTLDLGPLLFVVTKEGPTSIRIGEGFAVLGETLTTIPEQVVSFGSVTAYLNLVLYYDWEDATPAWKWEYMKTTAFPTQVKYSPLGSSEFFNAETFPIAWIVVVGGDITSIKQIQYTAVRCTRLL